MSRTRKKNDMKTFNPMSIPKNSGHCGHSGIIRIDGHVPRPMNDLRQWAVEKSGLGDHLPKLQKIDFCKKWPLYLLAFG